MGMFRKALVGQLLPSAWGETLLPWCLFWLLSSEQEDLNIPNEAVSGGQDHEEHAKAQESSFPADAQVWLQTGLPYSA